MHSGASMLPHPDKAHRGGEDAFFISEPPLAVGVADGVGGWAEIGVDAGAYARLFMVHAKEEAEALMSGGAGAAAAAAATAASAAPLSPQAVLERAYYRTNVQGSSTVCILALNGSTLCASNLGDSGFVLVRDGAPAFQSPQQQHNFNFPYQLGSADGGASDHPQSAMRFELTVQPGDIIITGTDGLWDNVFAEEASTIVARCKAQGDGPEAAAHTLCRYVCPRAWSPTAAGRRQAWDRAFPLQVDTSCRTPASCFAPRPPRTLTPNPIPAAPLGTPACARPTPSITRPSATQPSRQAMSSWAASSTTSRSLSATSAWAAPSCERLRRGRQAAAARRRCVRAGCARSCSCMGRARL
jgi:protein phosphatase PTC7